MIGYRKHGYPVLKCLLDIVLARWVLFICFILRVLVSLRQECFEQILLYYYDSILRMVIGQIVSPKLREHRADVQVCVRLARGHRH